MVYTKRILYYAPDNPKIRLACFGDLHEGDKGFSRKHFRRWRDKQNKEPQTWFINLGDNIEAIGPKDKRFTLGHINPDYLMAENLNGLINMQVKDFIEDMEPIKGRLLGLARGNHEQKLLDMTGFDTHDMVCQQLGVPDIGYSFLMLLTLRQEGGGGRTRSVRVYGHHGWGGGSRTLGGDKTKVAGKLGEYEADIYLFGHSHQAWDEPKPRISVNNYGHPVSKPMLIANTGTFKKSLSEGPVPTWAETKGFPPQDLGGRVIEIDVLNHEWVGLKVVE
jgi:hypothetical protein